MCAHAAIASNSLHDYQVSRKQLNRSTRLPGLSKDKTSEERRYRPLPSAGRSCPASSCCFFVLYIASSLITPLCSFCGQKERAKGNKANELWRRRELRGHRMASRRVWRSHVRCHNAAHLSLFQLGEVDGVDAGCREN